MGTLSMADGGLTFSLLTFQYLVGWGKFNLVFSMNLFRLVYYESMVCGSPIPHKRDRDRVPLCNNGTDLAPIR
ncbi:MAG: hypothetical protein ABSD46_01685 [Bacteroidota bacterium]